VQISLYSGASQFGQTGGAVFMGEYSPILI
jgi:hypothetical protein